MSAGLFSHLGRNPFEGTVGIYDLSLLLLIV